MVTSFIVRDRLFMILLTLDLIFERVTSRRNIIVKIFFMLLSPYKIDLISMRVISYKSPETVH